MFRYVTALSVFFTIVHAGYLEAPLAYHAPVIAAPVAVKAALPVATSYQNTFKISAAPVPVVVKAAPIVAAPVIHSAPIIHYAPGPAVIKSPLLAAPLPYSYH